MSERENLAVTFAYFCDGLKTYWPWKEQGAEQRATVCAMLDEVAAALREGGEPVAWAVNETSYQPINWYGLHRRPEYAREWIDEVMADHPNDDRVFEVVPLYAAPQERGGWRPMSDPPPRGWVLVRYSEHDIIAAHVSPGLVATGWEIHNGRSPTHWQPLPVLPEEESNGDH